MHGPSEELTGLGVLDRDSLNALFSATYEELRRLAASVRKADYRATISPTALVNEAWLKLVQSPPFGAVSRLHFKRIAARAMRQVLVEAARRRGAGKRGAHAALVTFDEELEGFSTAEDLLALDSALDTLGKLSPRQCAVVESRFFGGFEVPEVAAMLGISEATVLRDWRAARAWLGREVRRAP